MKFGVQEQRHHRQLGGGIAVRQAATDGAAVTDREMRHMRHRAGENRLVPRDHRRGLELMVPYERADADVRRGLPDERQVLDAVDVDEDRRAQQAEIEEGNEALPAGNDLGVVAAIGQ